MAVMPTAQSTTEMMYQVLRVSVVSTIGAHRNFQTCGNMPEAMSSAPSSTVRLWRVHRKAIATLTYPLIAPNGMMSTAKANGFGGRGDLVSIVTWSFFSAREQLEFSRVAV